MSQKRRTVADEPFLLVRSNSMDLPAGSHVGGHHHDWHQLVYVESGLLTVDTGQGSWLAPPSWAVWVPAHTLHALRFSARSAFRTIYLRPDSYHHLATHCYCLAVAPLLRELILRTAQIGMLDARQEGEAAIAVLIVGELDRPGPPPFVLPQPKTMQMVEAARMLMSAGRNKLDTPTLARAVGLGVRTLERRFRAETGLTIGRWQQQRKLLVGLEHVASGGTVKGAAAVAGFGTASAYVASFRKIFGTTPGRYFGSGSL